MSTVTKVVGFALALVAVFAAMVGVGRLVGPVGEPVAAHDGGGHGASDGDSHGDDHLKAGGARPASAELPGGLQTSADGYTLGLSRNIADPGGSVPISFSITGPDGAPVTAFETVHDKRLHLIAVRRDQSGFQHVHPRMDADGAWRTRLTLSPGTWRLFADFTATGGDPLTLGTDLQVRGDYRPATPAAPRRTAQVDGYTVTLDGALVAGDEAKLTLRVTRDGNPVTDLQPYLGAYGHLVALREGDLAYLHVHPDGSLDTSQPGPEIVFHTEVPSEGRYRLHLDFRHGDTVHSASFVVPTRHDGADPQDGGSTETSPEGGHDDSSGSHDH